MSEQQRQAYLLWLQARGLSMPAYARTAELGHPAGTADSATPVPPDAAAVSAKLTPQLRALFVSDVPLLPEEAALLDKMISAMRLRPEEVRVVAASEPRPDAQLIVILGENSTLAIFGDGRSWHSRRGQVLSDTAPPFLLTFHPRDLLQTPASKRAAWTDLQAGMAALGLLATN